MAVILFRTEYGAFWKCVQVGGMYLLVQLCKMMLLATFFPTLDSPYEAAGLFTVSLYHSVSAFNLPKFASYFDLSLEYL